MSGTTSTALPSFFHDQHHETDVAKRKGLYTWEFPCPDWITPAVCMTYTVWPNRLTIQFFFNFNIRLLTLWTFSFTPSCITKQQQQRRRQWWWWWWWWWFYVRPNISIKPKAQLKTAKYRDSNAVTNTVGRQIDICINNDVFVSENTEFREIHIEHESCFISTVSSVKCDSVVTYIRRRCPFLTIPNSDVMYVYAPISGRFVDIYRSDLSTITSCRLRDVRTQGCFKKRLTRNEWICRTGKLQTEQHGSKNDRSGRNAVGARCLFARSCRFSSCAIRSVIFYSCVFHCSKIQGTADCTGTNDTTIYQPITSRRT